MIDELGIIPAPIKYMFLRLSLDTSSDRQTNRHFAEDINNPFLLYTLLYSYLIISLSGNPKTYLIDVFMAELLILLTDLIAHCIPKIYPILRKPWINFL